MDNKIISIDKSYTNEIEQYRSKLIELSSEKIEDFKVKGRAIKFILEGKL